MLARFFPDEPDKVPLELFSFLIIEVEPVLGLDDKTAIFQTLLPARSESLSASRRSSGWARR